MADMPSSYSTLPVSRYGVHSSCRSAMQLHVCMQCINISARVCLESYCGLLLIIQMHSQACGTLKLHRNHIRGTYAWFGHLRVFWSAYRVHMTWGMLAQSWLLMTQCCWLTCDKKEYGKSLAVPWSVWSLAPKWSLNIGRCVCDVCACWHMGSYQWSFFCLQKRF